MLSVFAPRKIPFLYKLYEKAGGDMATAKEKNYAKVPIFSAFFNSQSVILLYTLILCLFISYSVT